MLVTYDLPIAHKAVLSIINMTYTTEFLLFFHVHKAKIILSSVGFIDISHHLCRLFLDFTYLPDGKIRITIFSVVAKGF